MSAIWLRITLATILATTIVVRVYAATAPRVDVREAAVEILRKHGFSRDSREEADWFTSFSVAGCPLPLRIRPVSLYLGDNVIPDQETGPGYLRRFVYFDREWSNQDRFTMQRKWLKQRLFALFGLSTYVPEPVALLVVEPIGCPATKAIDWSLVWTDTLHRTHT